MNYISFLRGINISGKNKIPMADIKKSFQELGFTDVITYLNSGNIAFTSNETSILLIRKSIEKMILKKFGFSIPVYVITQEALSDILEHAPSWWGTDSTDLYDNIIFILTEDTPDSISALIGPASDKLEFLEFYDNIIFWSFDRRHYQKCTWWKKTASAGIAERLTIRTAGTIKKVLAGKAK